MQRLQHCPHIVRVIDGFVDDTYRYMVMELCFGLDLVDSIMEELVNDDPSQEAAMLVVHPNIPHVSAVFREMLTALVECHANGVGHMVLISPAVRPMLLCGPLHNSVLTV